MATNDKGSDLDVFEGLTKKGGSGSQSTVPPPPPGGAGQTLLGMPAQTPWAPPSPQPNTSDFDSAADSGVDGSGNVDGPSADSASADSASADSASADSASAYRAYSDSASGDTANADGGMNDGGGNDGDTDVALSAPKAPPPPGRGSLPPIDPVAPAYADQIGQRPSSDVDWDDEDEATHIFDKGDEAPNMRSAPLPAAGMPAPFLAPKSTLLGLTPPPGARMTPPPPPPGLLGRASSIPPGPGGSVSSLPPPPVGALPPPSMTLHGLGGMPQSRSFPPPPAIPSLGTVTMPPMRAALSEAPQATLRSEETMLRPPPNRTQMVVLGSLVLALVVGAILLLLPHGGRAIVNVTDPHGATVGRVDIYVDGHKQCDTAPCIIEQLSTGAHEVKLLAEGYDAPPVQAINVESHKDSMTTIVLGGTSKGTGVKVSGTQQGVKLYVDDKEIGPLPQDYRDMSPGDHMIKIIGSERYQPLERRITLERDRVEDLGSVTLKVLKGKATISLATPGARVYLVAGTDRRELPMLPISVDIDTTRTWSLQAIRQGYAEYNQPISFDDGQAEKNYVVMLEPRGAQAFAQGGGWAPAPQLGGGGGGGGPPQQAYQPPPQAAPRSAPLAFNAPPPQAAPQAGGGGAEGFLNINSIPPSTVFLDGRQLGPTPKVHVGVSPGPHQVRFVNSEQNLQKTISIAVTAGETKLAVAKLSN
jgi:hypothetical protein